MSNYREYRSENQSNTSPSTYYTISMGTRAPAVARRIWKTLTDAENWVSDELAADVPDATAGLLITVIGDTEDKNGVYMVQYVNSTAGFPTANYTENGINYTKGQDTTLKLVKVASENSVAGLASLQETVKATGVTVGNVKNGDELVEGSTLTDIIKQIFLKKIETEAVLPTITFSGVNSTEGKNITTSQTLEIGTLVPTLQLNCTLNTDNYGCKGYYRSSDTDYYSNEEFNTINECQNGRLNANCTIGTVTYKDGNTQLSSNILSGFNITGEGTIKTISVNCTVGSTVTPKNNLNTADDGIRIDDDRDWVSASIKFSGVYKYFYGYGVYIENPQQREHIYEHYFETKTQIECAVNGTSGYATLVPGDCAIGKETTVGSMIGTDAMPAMFLILPNNHKTITDTRDTWGGEAKNKWELQNTFNYTNGNKTTTYYVYAIGGVAEPTPYNQIKFS